MRERLRLTAEIVLVAMLMIAGASSALAQDLLHVTGVSAPGAAWSEDVQGTREVLGTRGTEMGEIQEGVVQVTSGHQLMLLSDSGVVVIVLGPARLSCGLADEQMLIILADGKLIVIAAWPKVDAAPLVVMTPAGQDGVRAVEAVASPGYSYFFSGNGLVRVAFRSEGALPGATALTARGQARSIKNGELLTVEGPAIRVEPAADWLASEQFDTPWGINLGVASAQAARPALESDLFVNITSWDFYGGKEYVTSRLEAGRFRPEIRQVVTTVTTPQRVASAAGGVREASGFPAANEVPLLSPAALSVVNPTENVTAIQLNIQARGLLTQTGSRGLGFRGLSQLAIPGLFGAGTPTVGPAGLGAD
ncbi:MAG: hypothetical protein KKI02_04390 [Planctomycetes bacterium]|nr:hypothetical protein [Planctomycetota bacterium]